MPHMTQAEELIVRFHARVDTRSAKDIAARIDPRVQITRQKNPHKTTYQFHDGSIAITYGSGRHHEIVKP